MDTSIAVRTTGALPDSWYAFHFGSKFANSTSFDPETLYGAINRECYIMLADFCSFTSFFKATEDLALIDPLMTSFYSQIRKAIHKHFGMLDKIIGDSVVAVWGLHVWEENIVQSIFSTAQEMVAIARQIAAEWQSQIDLLIEPKGLRLGLSKGPIVVIRRDPVYPGISILGNPINLAARLQAAAQPNQLVCSNLVYKDIEKAGLNVALVPYKNESSEEFLNAKNFGMVKAWVLNMK